MAPRQIPRSSLVLVALVLATAVTTILPASAAGSCLVKNRTSGTEYARSTGASLQEAIRWRPTVPGEASGPATRSSPASRQA